MGDIVCSCSALGALSKMLSEDNGDTPRVFNASSLRHEFIYESVGSERKIAHTGAITGYLGRLSSGTREKSYLVQGTIAVQPSPLQLSAWLPRIFGGPTVGTNVGVTSDIPPFDLLIYKENGIFRYRDCFVAQAMLRGKTSNGGEGMEFMELLINIIGMKEDVNTVIWPSPEPDLSVDSSALPYAMFESSFEIDNTEILYERIGIMIDNKLDPRTYNKRFVQCIRSTGRDISIDIQAPFTCVNLGQSLALNTEAGAGKFTLATDDGDFSTVLDFPAIRNTFTTPNVSGPSTVPLEFKLEAYRTVDEAEAVVTHDALA